MSELHENLHVCMRLSDLPEPPFESIERDCERCGSAVWSSVQSLAFMQEQGESSIVCSGCALELMQAQREAGLPVPVRAAVNFDEPLR